MKKTNRRSDEQVSRFKEAARELGCDDSEEAFDEALRKVARHRPKDGNGKPPTPKKRKTE
jgi:hypothetical protein